MKYSLTNQAKVDLRNIWQYGVHKFGATQADEYFQGLILQFEQIASSPLLYPKVEHLHPDAHKCVYGTDSIYYRVLINTVEIMTIVGSQDLQSRL